MTMRTDLLITGFGPFPGVERNPTSGLALTLAVQLRRKGLKTKALVLPTSYADGLPLLKERLCTLQPRAVLMLGLAGRSRCVRIEQYGRDDASPTAPDVGGKMPPQSQSVRGMPWRSTASLQSALAACHAHGLRARQSPVAGRYLCNAAYALALAETAGKGITVLFVHIPWPRGFRGKRPLCSVAAWRPAVAALVRALIDAARTALLRPARLMKAVPL